MKRKHTQWFAMVCLLALLAASCMPAALADSRTYPIYRKLAIGCRGEDVYNVMAKLYELGYLPKPPTGEPEDAVYTAALAAAVKKYETTNYIDPATVVPPTEPVYELRATAAYVHAVDSELNQEEQIALLRTEPGILSPANVKALARNGTVQLTWGAVKGVTGYRVYRDGQLIAEPTAPRFTDSDAVQGVDHTYRINSVSFSTEPQGADVAVYLDYFYRKVALADLRRSPLSYSGTYVQFGNLLMQTQLNVENSADAYLIVTGNNSPMYLYLQDFMNWPWANMKNGVTITSFLVNDRISFTGQYLGVKTVTYQNKPTVMPYFAVHHLTLTAR